MAHYVLEMEVYYLIGNDQEDFYRKFSTNINNPFLPHVISILQNMQPLETGLGISFGKEETLYNFEKGNLTPYERDFLLVGHDHDLDDFLVKYNLTGDGAYEIYFDEIIDIFETYRGSLLLTFKKFKLKLRKIKQDKLF